MTQTYKTVDADGQLDDGPGFPNHSDDGHRSVMQQPSRDRTVGVYRPIECQPLFHRTALGKLTKPSERGTINVRANATERMSLIIEDHADRTGISRTVRGVK